MASHPCRGPELNISRSLKDGWSRTLAAAAAIGTDFCQYLSLWAGVADLCKTASACLGFRHEILCAICKLQKHGHLAKNEHSSTPRDDDRRELTLENEKASACVVVCRIGDLRGRLAYMRPAFEAFGSSHDSRFESFAVLMDPRRLIHCRSLISNRQALDGHVKPFVFGNETLAEWNENVSKTRPRDSRRMNKANLDSEAIYGGRVQRTRACRDMIIFFQHWSKEAAKT